MSNNDKTSQAANNNGTLGHETEEEYRRRRTNPNSVNNEIATPDGVAENDRHWPHSESKTSAIEAEAGARNYPGVKNNEGQISHSENVGGTAAEDL